MTADCFDLAGWVMVRPNSPAIVRMPRRGRCQLVTCILPTTRRNDGCGNLTEWGLGAHLTPARWQVRVHANVACASVSLMDRMYSRGAIRHGDDILYRMPLMYHV